MRVWRVYNDRGELLGEGACDTGAFRIEDCDATYPVGEPLILATWHTALTPTALPLARRATS